MNAYASDKILAHLPVIQQLRNGEQPNPVHVQMILSDLCNQDCGFCAYRMSGYTTNQLFGVANVDGTVNNNPNRMIPCGKAREILEDCKVLGVKAIQFTGGGEPTVHPQFAEIFRHSLDLGMNAALVTNGVRMSSVVRESLMWATWCRISIDAGDAELYGKMRGVSPDVYNRVLGNIRELVHLRNQQGSTLHIGIGFVVTSENWMHVKMAAETAKRLGVDSFRISAVFQPNGINYFQPFRKTAGEYCRAAEEFSDDRFAVINMFTDRLGDLIDASPEYQRCGYQHVTTYIGGDLNVYRCCNTAYNERGLIGSLANQRFRSLWQSQAKRDDFAQFDARGCERCQFNEKNRTINSLIDFNPTHEDFV